MKKILLVTLILIIPNFVYSASPDKECLTFIQKLKPSCNFIGKAKDGLQNFSDKNKTIGQSLGMDKKKSKTLNEFSKENKTIDQTFRNIKDKIK